MIWKDEELTNEQWAFIQVMMQCGAPEFNGKTKGDGSAYITENIEAYNSIVGMFIKRDGM